MRGRKARRVKGRNEREAVEAINTWPTGGYMTGVRTAMGGLAVMVGIGWDACWDALRGCALRAVRIVTHVRRRPPSLPADWKHCYHTSQLTTPNANFKKP